MDSCTYNTDDIKAPTHLFPLVRHFSYRLTPILLKWPITPNQITLISLFLGLAGAACFLSGIWSVGVMGGLLLVACYIFDNCDGEVARIKGLSSEFGARLDDLSDWLVDLSFFVALGYGTTQVTGQQFWLWLGLATALGIVIDYLVDQFKEAQHKKIAEAKTREERAQESRRPQDTLDWLIYIFHKLSRADFCVIVLLLAVFNVTWVLLPLAAVGAQIYWITDLFERTRGFHI
jgi:phosphatidylglycerophosphate synthase